MAESDVFSVDVDEALKVTDLDLQNVNLLSDQDDMGFTLPPDDSTWPYYSNQENGQPFEPDAGATMTSHEIPKPSVKRFVRPESVGKGSPGFTYSRPEIKVPDLRRNIGGKVHDPTLKKANFTDRVTVSNPTTCHQAKVELAKELPKEDVPCGFGETRSGIHLAVLSSLQAAHDKSKAPEGTSSVEPRDNRPVSEHVTIQMPPNESTLMGPKNAKVPFNGPATHHVATMHSSLQGPRDENDAELPHGTRDVTGISALVDVAESSEMSKTAPRQTPSRPVIRQNPSQATPPVLKLREAGGIEKRRNRRQPHASSVLPTVEDGPSVPDQVEILQILAFRAKQERDAQQAMARSLEVQRKHVERMKSEHLSLEALLNQGLERENTQKAELERFKSLLSGLKGKAKKLDDYVKGLSNDHNKLRDDAISLRQQQESLQDDRRVIQTTLSETRNTLQSIATIDKGAISEARMQLGNLQKVINQQHGQLMDKSDLLDMERKRLRTLEGELSKIATSQERMVESIRYDQKELLKGVQALLDQYQKAAQTDFVKSTVPPAALKRCVELLEQVHSRKNVQPEELHEIGESLQEQVRSITNTLETTNEKFEGHHETVTNLLTRFDSLMIGFKTQEQLAEKAARLRETESILRERTEAKDNSLAMLQQQIVDLQHRESMHLQSISNLQVKLNAPTAPSENPRLLQQVNELEFRNRTLQQEASGLQATIEGLREQINTQDERFAEAVENVRQGEAAMEEVKVLEAKIQQVKADFEVRAVIEHEKLRQEFSKASSEEKRSMTRGHANAMHQVQRQLSTSHDNTTKIEEKLKDAVRVQAEQAQAINTLRAQTDQYEYEKKENEKSITHLEAQLQEATRDGLSKDAKIQTLGEATTDLGKKKSEALAERDEARHLLTSHLTDTASKHTKILEQINAICAKNDKTATPAVSIENAVKTLARCVDMLRDDSQTTIVATQDPSQELLFSSEPEPVSRRRRSHESEDVALNRRDRDAEEQVAKPVSISTPQSTRPRAPSQLQQTPFRRTVQESHVEETTTRSVKRMVSNFDLAGPQMHAGSSSRRREAVPTLITFADIHGNSQENAQDSPAPENMKDFFPATPLLPAWPTATAQPIHPLAKSTPTGSSMTQERDMPSILTRPTSSVIRGDPATSPTPNQTAHSRSKSRVETSSSKTRKTLKTTETVKESVPPKGILMSSRASKRSATDALLEGPSRPSRRRSGAPGFGLGPIISSQSLENQGGAMPKVGGKKGAARRGSRKDKYQERFANGV